MKCPGAVRSAGRLCAARSWPERAAVRAAECFAPVARDPLLRDGCEVFLRGSETSSSFQKRRQGRASCLQQVAVLPWQQAARAEQGLPAPLTTTQGEIKASSNFLGRPRAPAGPVPCLPARFVWYCAAAQRNAHRTHEAERRDGFKRH